MLTNGYASADRFEASAGAQRRDVASAGSAFAARADRIASLTPAGAQQTDGRAAATGSESVSVVPDASMMVL